MRKVEVKLLVNGTAFRTWEGINLINSYRAIARAASFTVNQKDIEITRFDECKVEIDGVLWMTGAIDSISKRLEDDDNSISIECRSYTADFIDCSYPSKEAEFKNITLEGIANIVTKGFKSRVINKVGKLPNLRTFTVDAGDTIESILRKAAKASNVSLSDDADGNLLIINSHSGELVVDVPPERIGYEFKSSNLFSEYIVRGQKRISTKVVGKNSKTKKTASKVKKSVNVSATVTSDAVKRYRPHVIQTDMAESGETVQKRAEFYKARLEGEAEKIDVMYPSFYANGSDLFQCGKLVHFSYAPVGIKGRYIVDSISYSMSDTASSFQVTLLNPAALIKGFKQSPNKSQDKRVLKNV